MGYLHIDNLYKNQAILLFKECYAMEKIHGTSAHVRYENGEITFFPGGEKYDNFVKIFDKAALLEKFQQYPQDNKIVIFGEAYGGKQQRQSWRYGKDLKFVAFDVRIGDYWLGVPSAERLVQNVGLEFVHYVKIPADMESMDKERDAPSMQAIRNGVGDNLPREGVVLRPLVEMVHGHERIIAKHKRIEERETVSVKKNVSFEEMEALKHAGTIAFEWVTELRLEHVLDKLKVDGEEVPFERIGEVIKAMVEDVTREADGEIVETKNVRKAIGTRAADLFKKRHSLLVSGKIDTWPGFIKK